MVAEAILPSPTSYTSMDLFSDSDTEAGPSRSRQTTKVRPAVNGDQDDFKIQINEEYANRFKHNQERAELHRLQEKYGAAAADILAGKKKEADLQSDDEDSDEDSEDETEDEEGEQVTAEVDAAILRTLAKIRGGDSSIYEAGKQVFDEEKALAAASAMLPKNTRDKVNKKVTLADYQRSRLRDLMANSEDPAQALAEATTSRTRADEAEEQSESQPLSHVQEQEQLRKQVTQAFHSMDSDEGTGLFTKRQGTGQESAENKDEAAEYRKFLLQSMSSDQTGQALRDAVQEQTATASGTTEGPAPTPQRSASGKTKSLKSQKELNEEFLTNYLLNRGWMENPNAAPRLTSLDRRADDEEDEGDTKLAVQHQGTDSARRWEDEAAELDSEASFDSRAEAFEQAFNFRYEAMQSGNMPDQVQSYARQTQNSVRRVDDKRKSEREERRKRKELEKKQKKEDLDRLRELKKQQLRDQLKQLREAAGSESLAIDPDQLEGDFDEAQHDKMMAAFGDAYYGEEGEDAGMKPTWDDDIDIADILAEEEEGKDEAKASGKKSKQDKKRNKKSGSGEGIDMDADFVDGAGGEGDERLSKKERKKLKKKLRAQAAADGEVGDSEALSYQDAPLPANEKDRKAAAKKLVEEYRNLDYEDVIDDLPTRFHYTTVPKTNYGMTAAEILMADDKDLNDVVGLKQIQPYRYGEPGSSRSEKKPRDLNRKLKEFRRKLDNSEGRKHRRSTDDEGAEKRPQKRLGKKQRMKAKAAAEAAAASGAEHGDGDASLDTNSQPKDDGAVTNGADEAATAEQKAQRKKEKKERKRAATLADVPEETAAKSERKSKKQKVA
ncbi:unnamed protein product [Jaminaea pallidilutea]